MPTPPEADRRTFIRRHTSISSPPLVPELRFHLITPTDALWEAPAPQVYALGIGLPFWAFCWPGGQALARYVIDHPHEVRGRSVLDLGAGCGVAGLAAAASGAARVDAAEIDPMAAEAVALNAEINHVEARVLLEDVLQRTTGDWEVILAADVCYDRDDASRMLRWLLAQAGKGARVLLADPFRGFVPLTGLVELARYDVPTHPELEDTHSRCTVVWTPAV